MIEFLAFFGAFAMGHYVTSWVLNKFFVKRINITIHHLDGTTSTRRLDKTLSKKMQDSIDTQLGRKK